MFIHKLIRFLVTQESLTLRHMFELMGLINFIDLKNKLSDFNT